MKKREIDKEISRIIESQGNILHPFRKTEIVHMVMNKLKIKDIGKTFFDIADRIEEVSRRKGYVTTRIPEDYVKKKKLKKVM